MLKIYKQKTNRNDNKSIYKKDIKTLYIKNSK